MRKNTDSKVFLSIVDIQIPYPVESFSELGISKEVRVSFAYAIVQLLFLNDMNIRISVYTHILV